jgi:carbon-monoxide dehydrogenase small subunit
MIDLSMTINGKPVTISVSPTARLVDVLRESLHLTGTREGCGEGECGACTVLLDGRAVCSCLVLAAKCQGRAVETIEGVANPGSPGDVAAAIVAEGGVQCGFCTPGIVIAAEALLRENDDPSEDDVRRALAGNLCRCTGYRKVITGVLRAATARRTTD